MCLNSYIMSTMKVKTALKKYRDYITDDLGLAETTIKSYMYVLDNFTRSMHIRTGYITDITPAVIKAYQNKLSSDETSYKTKNMRLVPIRAFLAFLEDSVYFSGDDLGKMCYSRHVRLFKNRTDSKMVDVPAKGVVEVFKKPLRENVRKTKMSESQMLRSDALVELLLATGLRISEAQSLDRGAFDEWDGKMVKLTVIGKGSKPRLVFVNKETVAVVQRYLDVRNDQEKALFVTCVERVPVKRADVRSLQYVIENRLKMLQKEGVIGKDVHLSAHTLRHIYATRLLDKGVELRYVQAFLGHASITTTQRYTHIVDSKLEDEYKKVYN